MEVRKENSLVDIMEEIIILLRLCNDKTRMDEWLTTLKHRLEDADNPQEKKEDLKRIMKITGGMGSLSDIYLKPNPKGKLREEEANKKLKELTHTLYIEVISQLQSSKHDK